jgi:hypothetical protein
MELERRKSHCRPCRRLAQRLRNSYARKGTVDLLAAGGRGAGFRTVKRGEDARQKA